MDLSLTDSEATALRDALESYLGDLHSEIVHTDSRDLRDRLRQREQCLRRLLDRLGQGEGTRAAS
jgi:hypothetical protein